MTKGKNINEEFGKVHAHLITPHSSHCPHLDKVAAVAEPKAPQISPDEQKIVFDLDDIQGDYMVGFNKPYPWKKTQEKENFW